MRVLIVALWLAGATLLSAPGSVVAADEEASVPLAPTDAVGPWTLESGGRVICVLNLGKEKTANGALALKAPAACGEALPANLAGWAPTADGMSFVDADGKVLVAFNRWSNSLFVSHRAGGADIQLQRGGPSS